MHKKGVFVCSKRVFLSSAACLIFRWKITSRSEKVLSQFPHLKLDLERHNRYWNWKIKDTKFIIQGFPSDQEELSPTKWTKIGNFANKLAYSTVPHSWLSPYLLNEHWNCNCNVPTCSSHPAPPPPSSSSSCPACIWQCWRISGPTKAPPFNYYN